MPATDSPGIRVLAHRLAVVIFGACLLAACGNDSSSSEEPAAAASVSAATLGLQFDGASRLESETLAALAAHPDAKLYLSAGSEAANDTQAIAVSAAPRTPQAVNETPLPHATQAPVSARDRLLLKAYLNAPGDSTLASFLALTSLNKSLLNPFNQGSQGERFKQTLMAQYFLHRAQDLGRRDGWIAFFLAATQEQIDTVVRRGSVVTSEENHPAHRFFNQTFNYREADRYTALARLLDDFAVQPKNVYTAFLVTAASTWIGGEADYDDATALQNFVVGSYLSIHTMDLARQLEVAWLANNSATPRFRMASILGGFSALNRRWLAKLHGDTQAIAALDDEHRQWRLVQRAFHAFTVGLSFFPEQENFGEGMAAWADSFTHCAQEPVRTCSNLPRFSHNFQSFVLGYVDFLLKAGQGDAARQFLSIRFVPEQFPPMAAYKDWDLGRAGWEYREANIEPIMAAYANNDPSDDPMNFMLKKKRWGADTATCQVCHQAQSSFWTDEEKEVIVLPPESVATVGNWPAVATTWYGSRRPASAP